MLSCSEVLMIWAQKISLNTLIVILQENWNGSTILHVGQTFNFCFWILHHEIIYSVWINAFERIYEEPTLLGNLHVSVCWNLRIKVFIGLHSYFWGFLWSFHFVSGNAVFPDRNECNRALINMSFAIKPNIFTRRAKNRLGKSTLTAEQTG